MSPRTEPAVRLEVHTREPFAEGHRFGATGAYAVLTATARHAVDPDDPRVPAHRTVPDLDLAPRASRRHRPGPVQR
ncbi:hypothetical protein ABZX77_51660 [Streptomyces sp. NPDC004237]|uniref:hypothetical protein n=1 Tax=Streptomyces sp. NPDC004237 TaxID=3154455 RepID=UPI0033AB1598